MAITSNRLRESWMGGKEPVWREWNIPMLRQTCIQANANVAVLEPAQDSTFDYWLKISTLEFRKQLLLPVEAG